MSIIWEILNIQFTYQLRVVLYRVALLKFSPSIYELLYFNFAAFGKIYVFLPYNVRNYLMYTLFINENILFKVIVKQKYLEILSVATITAFL